MVRLDPSWFLSTFSKNSRSHQNARIPKEKASALRNPIRPCRYLPLQAITQHKTNPKPLENPRRWAGQKRRHSWSHQAQNQKKRRKKRKAARKKGKDSQKNKKEKCMQMYGTFSLSIPKTSLEANENADPCLGYGMHLIYNQSELSSRGSNRIWCRIWRSHQVE